MIRDVEVRGESCVVERHGEPVAAVVPLGIYEQWKRQQDRSLEIVRKAQQNSMESDPSMTEEKAMELALQAVEEVRAERRAERDAAKLRRSA